MKFLQQLFGGNVLSLFGRSRPKVSVVNNANNGDGLTDGGQPATGVTSTRCQSGVGVDAVDSYFLADDRSSDSDRAEASTPPSPMSCWSPTVNRICWGSPAVARRSATRRADLERESRKEAARLPRSRSLIRTNPWLPASSPPPPPDRRLHGLRRRSPSPASGSGSSVSCPSTPADSPAEPGRRWTATVGGGAGRCDDATTPVASEGYFSVSSLFTTTDSATVSTTACSDDMQMSVDSLASLFPTLMSSSSTSFHDEKTSASVIDSGIVISTTSNVGSDLDSAVQLAVQENEDFDVMATRSTISNRSSDCGSSTNPHKTSTSATTLKEHLGAVQTALERGSSSDYEFDADVFPFGCNVRQSSASPKRRSDLSHVETISPPPRDVDAISSSLAASVERLRRGRISVDGAFGRALAEERRRERELTRLRRRMVDAQRDVLLGTLRDLRRELDDQCRRLQSAYDAVLTARWPQLHANTAYVTSTAVRHLSSMCPSAAV